MNKKLHRLTDQLEDFLPNSTQDDLKCIYNDLTPEFKLVWNKALEKAKKRIEYKNNQRKEAKGE